MWNPHPSLPVPQTTLLLSENTKPFMFTGFPPPPVSTKPFCIKRFVHLSINQLFWLCSTLQSVWHICNAICIFFCFLASHYVFFAVKSPQHQTASLYLLKYWGLEDLLNIFKADIKWTTAIPDCFLFASYTKPAYLALHGELAFLHYVSSHCTCFSTVKKPNKNPTLKWQSSPQEAWDTGVTTASRSQIPEQWCTSPPSASSCSQFTPIQGSNSISLNIKVSIYV